MGKHDIYKTIGLARKIVNEDYLKIAKQTYSIRLNNINDYQKEIDQNNFDIDYLQKNQGEFEKLKTEKIEKLEKDKKLLEKEFNEAIEKISPDSRELKIKEKDEALKKYDEKIEYYKKLDQKKYIEYLENKIKEFKEKAEKNKTDKTSILPENGTMW
ncbi:Uncharacterised protein, partial [Metamycoplasma alkalescens]